MNGEKAQVMVKPECIERGVFVREFRTLYRMELQTLASRAALSEPALSLFETGQRNLSGIAWKRVLQAIQAVVSENADGLGEEYERLSTERATIQFFPILSEEDALSWPTRSRIIDKRQKEIMASLAVWESLERLFPQADIEIKEELLRGEG